MAVSWKSIEMQISATRCWRGGGGGGGGGGGREEEVQCKQNNAQLCPAIFNRLWEEVGGGGRGDDEHLSNEKEPAPRAT